MFNEKLICAGFGGQGVMSLGQIVANAGMLEGRHVTWLPSYGPEMRGGAAYCCVVISDSPVGSPIITDDATSVIVMNLPSFQKFEQRVAPNGLLLVNSSMVELESVRWDIQAYYLPVVDEAAANGNPKMANMVMLGAYLELTGIVRLESVLKSLEKVFAQKSRRLLQANREALTMGMRAMRDRLPISAAI